MTPQPSLKTNLTFTPPKLTKRTQAFKLTKTVPKTKYEYVSDFFIKYQKLINQYNIVILFSKKNMGKSTVGYEWMKSYFNQGLGNMIYGRLQELEKKNARAEIYHELELLGLNPFYKRGMGSDYLFINESNNFLRLVNISSYQSLRGAIGDNINFIWFDEINAYSFPQNFEDDFINIISTLGRNNNFKLFMSGNNERGSNNPVLSALQLKFNWDYDGLQLASREINGVKILGIQMGAKCFKDRQPPIAEVLAKNNPRVYNTFYLGTTNNNSSSKIINLCEDYALKRLIHYWGYNDKLFGFYEATINDTENNIHDETAYMIKEEPYTYTSDKINKSVPLFTTNAQSDLLFKGAKMLDKDTGLDILKKYYLALKNNHLYFGDFESNDIFLNKLFPIYNLYSNTKETWYDKEIKFK